MSKPAVKILFLDDDDMAFESLKRSARYEFKEFAFEIVHLKSAEDAILEANNSYDAVVVDLELKEGGNGVDFITHVAGDLRLPVYVYSATPDHLPPDVRDKYVVASLKRGETYKALLDEVIAVFNTGITNITRNSGVAEKLLTEAYWSNIFPNLETWKNYALSGKDTEPAMFRSLMYHFLHALEDKYETALPEEMYVKTSDDKVHTGSLLKIKDKNEHWIVLTPACDLVKRKDGKYKAEYLLLVRVRSIEEEMHPVITPKKREGRISKMESLYNNDSKKYYYCLPESAIFDGGIVHFQHIRTIPMGSVFEEFENPQIVLAWPFTKDLLAAFSQYYGRQGKPDFEAGELAECYVARCFPEKEEQKQAAS